MFQLAIFISGRGSNMQAILEAVQSKTIPDTEVALVLCDHPSADGIAKARSKAIPLYLIEEPTYKSRLSPEIEDAIVAELQSRKVNLICLAGFMRMLRGSILKQYRNRILNIHPSLLPRYPGLNASKRALEAGEKESGCTVHIVDEGMDSGKILGQRKVEVFADDTPKRLSERILEQENILYPTILRRIAQGEINLP